MAIDGDVFFGKLESVSKGDGWLKTFLISFVDEDDGCLAKWTIEDFLWCEKPKYPRNLK